MKTSFKILLSGMIFGFGVQAAAEDQPKNQSTPNLHITAHPLGKNLMEQASPVSVLGEDQLRFKGDNSLGALLQNEPGVSATSFAPGASRPVIRGNSGERVRVLKNGVGGFDVSNLSDDHAVPTNPFSAKSVEVLRGPATLFYGNSAIGGVVNVTDNLIPEEAIGRAATGRVGYRAGDGNGEQSGAATLEGQAGIFNWHVSGFHQDTDDIDIPGAAESRAMREAEEAEEEHEHADAVEDGHADEHEEEGSHGRLENSATLSKGLDVGGSVVSERGFLGLGLSYFDSLYGVPGHSHEHEEEHAVGEDEAAAAEEGTKIDAEQVRVDLRGGLKQPFRGFKELKLRAGYGDYEHDELEDGAVGTTFTRKGLETRLEALHQTWLGLDGALGLHYGRSELEAVGEEALIPKSTVDSPALFVFEERKLTPEISMQGGVRYDLQVVDAAGFASENFHAVSSSLGLLWDPWANREYGLGLTLSQAERAPQPAELYSNGAHAATRTFEIGDPDLDQEKSWGVDLTVKKNTGFYNAVQNLFYQRYSDYIGLLPTGDVEDELPIYAYDNVRARFWGFESENIFNVLNVGPHDVDLVARIDYVRARNVSSNEPLPRIPPLRTQLGLRYETWLRGSHHLGAEIFGVLVEEQDRVAENELPTEDYKMLNAAAHYTLPVGATELTFFLRGTNLNDTEARQHVSFLKDIAPLAGRTVLFGVEGTF